MLHPWEAVFLDLDRRADELFEELIYRPWAIPTRAGWRPALDLHETPEAYHVEIDLPGVAPGDFRILVSKRQLTVIGQRQATPPKHILFEKCERPCGKFQRTLNLPDAVEPQLARAEYHHGTCRIYLPRKRPPEEQARPATASGEGPKYVLQVTIP